MEQYQNLKWTHIDEYFRQSWVNEDFEVWLSSDGYELYRNATANTAVEFINVFDTLSAAQSFAEAHIKKQNK